MNDRQRDYWFPLVVFKKDSNFGPFCRGCGKRVFKVTDNEKTKPKGIIDHINNNSEDTRLGNLQLVCRSCNKIKNPSGFIPKLIKTQSEKTNEKEAEWRKWILGKVAFAPNGVDTEIAINTGAELFSVSPETIERRWIKKITSSAGKIYWDKEDDILFLKSYIENKHEENRQKMLESRT